MNPFDIFLPLLVYPIINVLVVIYHLLVLAHIPYALGFAIIGLTVVIRGILYPFTAAQLKAASKMQSVAHHISALKEKHKGDSKRINAETMKLYKVHGINPAAGCLPVLIQMPIIFGLYTVLNEIAKTSSSSVVSFINNIVYNPALNLSKPWDTNFFGLGLGQAPSSVLSNVGFLIFLVPVVTAALQFVQSKMMLPQNSGEIKKTEKKSEDFATAFQAQSTYIFPVMIGFFSFSSPLGLSLYWNTFTIFGIIQQYKISGWGGLIKKK